MTGLGKAGPAGAGFGWESREHCSRDYLALWRHYAMLVSSAGHRWAWQGWAPLDVARQGQHSQTLMLTEAGCGLVWRGLAWRGSAVQGRGNTYIDFSK